MRPVLPLLPLILLATSVHSFSCITTVQTIPYKLTPLAGVRTVSKDTPTPPTTSEAKVQLGLCSEDGMPHNDDLTDEDQCPEGTRLCLTLLNHKASSEEEERITAVIPIWPVALADSEITQTALGSKGADGLRIQVKGNEYAGTQQYLNLSLICSQSAADPAPTFISYTSGVLDLEWATPDACPRADDSPLDPSRPEEGSDPSGGGFWRFIKSLFWLIILVLILYFGIGIFYNHQQYSARGWDLVPHRDFWRELPLLLSDLFGHVFAGLRGSNGGAGGGGGGGRGGYSSLG
ncbi:autophagy-related protein 27, partial [Tremellales sp. Uapishka_1]